MNIYIYEKSIDDYFLLKESILDFMNDKHIECTFHLKHELVYTLPKMIPANSLFIIQTELLNERTIDCLKRLKRSYPKLFMLLYGNDMQYAKEGYEIKICGYISKPINTDILYAFLEDICANINDEDYFVVSYNRIYHHILFNDVQYIESLQHHTYIHTTNNIYKTNMTLETLYKQADKRFVRCHRSFIVNVSCIKQLEKSIVELYNMQKIPISRQRFEGLKQIYNTHIVGES